MQGGRDPLGQRTEVHAQQADVGAQVQDGLDQRLHGRIDGHEDPSLPVVRRKRSAG